MDVFTLEDEQIVWRDKSSDIYSSNLNSRRPYAETLSVLNLYYQENVSTNQYIWARKELALGSRCVLKAKWPPRCTSVANFSLEENVCLAKISGVAGRWYSSSNFLNQKT